MRVDVLVVEETLYPETALVLVPFGELLIDGDDICNQHLSWLSYVDGETLPICQEDMLRWVDDEDPPSNPGRDSFDLRLAVLTPSETLLVSERSSNGVWRCGRGRVLERVAHLHRPRDLEEALLSMKILASPSRRWVVVFTESGFAAFHDANLTMSEEYDELLWLPVELTDETMVLDHYNEGTRSIRLIE